MAKRPSTPAPAPQRQPNTRPTRERESEQSMRDRGITPFIRPEHVHDGEWLKLTGFNAIRERNTDREQFTCEVENENGTVFTLGIRNGSPDHRILHRRFGADFRSWVGAVQVTIGEGRKGGSFVNVKDADTDSPIWDGGPPAPSDDDRTE